MVPSCCAPCRRLKNREAARRVRERKSNQLNQYKSQVCCTAGGSGQGEGQSLGGTVPVVVVHEAPQALPDRHKPPAVCTTHAGG